MAKYLTACLILISFSGCSTVDHRIGLPERPDLVPVNQSLWSKVPPEAQDIWYVNDRSLKRYIRSLEERILLHDK